MIQWGKLAIISASLLATFITWLRENELMNAGEQRMLASILTRQANDIQTAIKARQDASANNAAIPSGVSLPTDGHRRD